LLQAGVQGLDPHFLIKQAGINKETFQVTRNRDWAPRGRASEPGSGLPLVVKVRYDNGTVYIRFVGTHCAYDGIDARTI
jgi:hypothetical protein